MYKHLNNILEKNHIRNSRRKESLAKRTKTEMFGTKYELKKSESKLSVIGTTSSKKNVYDSFNHPEHKNFNAKDHEEAAKFHRDRINTKMPSRKADSIRHQESMHARWAKVLRDQ